MNILQRCIPPLIYFVALFVHPFLLLLSALQVLCARLCCNRPRKSIRNEVAVVTGGGGGLGRALCKELAEHGCNLAIADVNLAAAEAVAADIKSQYAVNVKAYEVDVSDYAAVVQFGNDVCADFCTVTLLFNNAGLMTFSDMLNPDWNEIQSMINVNLTAHFWLNKFFLPKMKAERRGHIVAICSVAAFFPLSELPVYCATKAGVKSLMSSLRAALKYDGFDNIHASTVYPYFIHTSDVIKEFITFIKVERMFPCTPIDQAAARIVQGVLRNEVDIVIPDIFAVLYRMNEVLPSTWRERSIYFISRPWSKRFRCLCDKMQTTPTTTLKAKSYTTAQSSSTAAT